MKTAKELKNGYQEIEVMDHANSKAYELEQIDIDTFCANYDRFVKMYAGWRKSVLTMFAKLAGITYSESSYIHRDKSNYQLYRYFFINADTRVSM